MRVHETMLIDMETRLTVKGLHEKERSGLRDQNEDCSHYMLTVKFSRPLTVKKCLSRDVYCG